MFVLSVSDNLCKLPVIEQKDRKTNSRLKKTVNCLIFKNSQKKMYSQQWS